MPKGVYAAASSMYADRFTVEVLANNMANGQTPGFRRAVPMRASFASMLADQGQRGGLRGDGAAGVEFDGTYTVFEGGQLTETGDSLDAALSGEGFYLLDDAGQPRLTRHSHFLLDENGLLQTDRGLPVMGQGGPIQVPPAASDIDIDNQGRIYAVIPTETGPQRSFIEQLRVVKVADNSALRGLNGELFDPGQQPLTDAQVYSVHQGFIEEANLEPIREMVEMIAAQRRYEAAQRTLNEQLETDSKYADILRGS